MKKFSLPKDGGLIEAGLPNGIKHSYERIPAHIFEDEDAASEIIADKIVEMIAANGGKLRLGLTTGSSPITLYRKLVTLCCEGKVSFKDVEIYSIDEYYPAPADAQSRNRRLYDELISKIDVRPENVHVPKISNVMDADKVSEFCAEYDEKASGLDLLVMGIGEQGQIGFNVSPADFEAQEAYISLQSAGKTLQTLSVCEMMRMNRVIICAPYGIHAENVRQVLTHRLSPEYPVTALKLHKNVDFLLDGESAAKISVGLAARFNPELEMYRIMNGPEEKRTEE